MSEPRIERVQEILDLAMERPGVERAAFVAGAAGSDRAMREEVMSLLAALDACPDALEPPTPAGEPQAGEPLTGLSFGSYQVGVRIGEGGMGVVYEAHDTRLGRIVAVKALPPALARDPHRRARLEQEARLLAALNHSNIAAIYGVEETTRGPVLVLEFVPGHTLAEELAQRRLSVDEAIALAIQIARGLEAAHAAGIVHRDLKPANIKITPEGAAKILDLGVARSAESPGRAAAATEPGLIVGSAAYMSPEQARARPVDRRADMWAFGCVLFEMLAGCRAFQAQSSSDTIAAILSAQPDWALLPAETPPHVRRLLLRCIEKDPQRRFRDAGDAVLELEGAGEATDTVQPRRSSAAAWLVAGVSLLAVAGLLLVWKPWQQRLASPPADRVAFSIDTPGPLVTDLVGNCLAISPDGRMLVFAAVNPQGRSFLYKRELNSIQSIVIPGTEESHSPFFSPDGRWLGFVHGREGATFDLRKVPIDGGPAKELGTFPLISACWDDGDNIIMALLPGRLRLLPVAGDSPIVKLPEPDLSVEAHSQPEPLPGGRRLLFTCWRKDGVRWRPRIEVLDMITGDRRVLVEGASVPKLVRDKGVLVYCAGSLLMGIDFDAATATTRGEARRIVDSLGGAVGPSIRATASENGVLAFVPGDGLALATDLAWFGSDGSSQTVYTGDLLIWTLRLSPDGSRVAFTTEQDPEFGLWVLDLARGNSTRIFAPARPRFPVWSPDGTRIAFQSRDAADHGAIMWTSADGSTQPEAIHAPATGRPGIPTGFSPDGRRLLIMLPVGQGEDTDIAMIDLDGDRTPKLLLNTRADRSAARFSPDGTLIAYSSTETGRAELYVQPYPALDVKILVSVEGGERPTWSADGRRLFYRYANTIYVTDITTEGGLKVSLPRVVLKDLPGIRYDTSADGERFIMARPRGSWKPQSRIDVILNGLEESISKPVR